MTTLFDEHADTREKNLQTVKKYCTSNLYKNKTTDNIYQLMQNQQHTPEAVRVCVTNMLSGLPVSDEALEQAKNIHTIGIVNISLLHVALVISDDELALRILNTNSEFNDDPANLFGLNPLHLACILGKKDLVEAMIEKGADVNALTHRNGYTPLLLVCSNAYKNKGIAEMLIDCGANQEAKTLAGDTPQTLAPEFFVKQQAQQMRRCAIQ